jgi:nucleotide-binding universal stress UspA family protein
LARVVVGVDGSSGSRKALAFALEEARLRGATLQVVHAWRTPLALTLPEPSIAGYSPLSVEDVERLATELREKAERLVESEVEEVAGDDPGLEVRRDVFESDAAEALIEAAAGADLLVVGSRGHGGFRGLLLGSVGQKAASHAPCPVVVVVPDAPAAQDER